LDSATACPMCCAASPSRRTRANSGASMPTRPTSSWSTPSTCTRPWTSA
jgi:hypothetical protein